jgi:Uma2 family endonuclease
MSTIVLDENVLYIPTWVQDLSSFRRWAQSDDFPAGGRIDFFNGEVWADMRKEQFSHNQIKGEYTSVLMPLAKRGRLGRYFPDGYRLSNLAAGLSANPDGMFASTESLRTGRVQLIEGAEEGYVELQGSPDMVLEVISPGSVEKDKEFLHNLYWQAQIREYWLVDARGERLAFDILRHAAQGYVPIRKQAGWLKSGVFSKSFRLTRETDELGHPEYTLAVR